MDLTTSYTDAMPADLLTRYELRETRMATKLIAATSPVEFAEILQVLNDFALTTADLVDAGGNESKLAARLNHAFRARGWREARVDTRVALELAVQPYLPAGEHGEDVRAAR